MAFDPLSAAFDLGGKILDKIFPDPVQRDQAKLKLLEMQQSGELAKLTAETDLAKGQMAINQVEASSEDSFTRRWRPFIGWVCGVAFAYHFVLQPLIAFLLSAIGHPILLPVFDMENLLTVLLGMLGLGGMRSYEKVKGLAR